MATTKIKCLECAKQFHVLIPHLTKDHEMKPSDYLKKHGDDTPLFSALGLQKFQELAPESPLAMAPRPRKKVRFSALFPNFGVKDGVTYDDPYEIFATAGSRTPKLDERYVFPEETTMDICAIIEKAERNRVYISGWSGTGKTQLVVNLAAKVNAELLILNGDAFIQRSDLIGRFTVKGGEVIFVPGILIEAMQRGCWLLINEFDTLRPDVVNLLKPILEDPAYLPVLELGDKIVRAHPDFRVIATANTFARGDASGLFTNTHVQSDADVRRWSVRLKLDYLPVDEEKNVLSQYFPVLSDKQITDFVTVGNKIRESFKKGDIDKTFSTAELVNWAENWTILGSSVHRAARISFLNGLEPDVQHAISEMIGAVFGIEKAR